MYSPQYLSLPSSSSTSTADMMSRAVNAVPMSDPVAFWTCRHASARSSASAQTLPRATSEAFVENRAVLSADVLSFWVA